MKLLLCVSCGDLVAPSRKELEVRWCACARHAVWWIDSQRGLLKVHDSTGVDGRPAPGSRTGWVIGLHNGLLTAPQEMSVTTREHVEAELHYTPDTYLFKRAHSLAVRINPGASSDTGWAPLPGVQK